MLERASRWSDLGVLLLRAGAGVMLAVMHGWGKMAAAAAHFTQGQEWGFVGAVAGLGFPFPRFFALCAALAEFAGGLLLAAGLFTRYAALLVTFNMLVAAYHHLRGDMRFELAAIYGLIALALVLIPPGRFSLDAWLRGRAKWGRSSR
jgi:putative oxidoreductase